MDSLEVYYFVFVHTKTIFFNFHIEWYTSHKTLYNHIKLKMSFTYHMYKNVIMINIFNETNTWLYENTRCQLIYNINKYT